MYLKIIDLLNKRTHKELLDRSIIIFQQDLLLKEPRYPTHPAFNANAISLNISLLLSKNTWRLNHFFRQLFHFLNSFKIMRNMSILMCCFLSIKLAIQIWSKLWYHFVMYSYGFIQFNKFIQYLLWYFFGFNI